MSIQTSEASRSPNRLPRSLRPAHPRDDPVVVFLADSKSAGHPSKEVDAEDKHLSESTHRIQALNEGRDVDGSTFHVADLDCCTPERRSLFERMWRLDNECHIDPFDPALGKDAQHYASDWVEVERVSMSDRFRWHRSISICESLSVPDPVRERVLKLMWSTDLRAYSHWQGIDGAVICFTALALTEYVGKKSIEGLMGTPWWPDVEQLADEVGLLGATGRSFRQALNHTQSNYGGEHRAD